ncbi:hypothetical protein STALF3_04295 [Streptomyces albidoflavus]|nr:hypothetical protein [Streptomyces albidoflavus]MBV7709075.1 hypothetical protein [Streptomyces albidoflavus]
MQTIGMKPSSSLTERHRGSPGGEAPTPVLAAAWCAAVAAGALLALTGPGAPWHSALTFVFLAAAPGGAVALALSGLDPWSRAVAALGATLAVNTLVAQALLMLGTWSARTGVVAVGAVGWLVLTGALAGRLVLRRRTARERVG